MSATWSPGDTVVMRHRRGQWLWAAPMRVVDDRGDFIALYLQPGTVISVMGDADGNRTRDFVHASRRITDTWGLNHALYLIGEKDQHATVLLWDEHTWELRCWYINFQDPYRRIALGFESMDLTLDLLIVPDRTTWQWKDEDEFAYGIEHGWYTEQQLAELKVYGARCIDAAQSGQPPFNEGWEHWRPLAAWTPPSLPAGYDA